MAPDDGHESVTSAGWLSLSSLGLSAGVGLGALADLVAFDLGRLAVGFVELPLGFLLLSRCRLAEDVVVLMLVLGLLGIALLAHVLSIPE